ncbi:MAG: hypothetical protein IJ094_12895 [Bacilli bacterium]|nr:hypothetical protein [Bacilli bacterium]
MLDDKVKFFVNGCGALIIEKDGGYAFNKVYSSPFLIRPETIEKIKKLLYDDLMVTCKEVNGNKIYQDIPYINLYSFMDKMLYWEKYKKNYST